MFEVSFSSEIVRLQLDTRHTFSIFSRKLSARKSLIVTLLLTTSCFNLEAYVNSDVCAVRIILLDPLFSSIPF